MLVSSLQFGRSIRLLILTLISLLGYKDCALIQWRGFQVLHEVVVGWEVGVWWLNVEIFIFGNSMWVKGVMGFMVIALFFFC